MKNITRRDFIKSSLMTGIGLTLATSNAKAFPGIAVKGANDNIRVGIIGLRSRGEFLMRLLRSQVAGIKVVALCDADTEFLEKEFKNINDPKVAKYVDVRKMLDDKNIDAVVVAAPDHWHALIAVWACQAGKDVYLEKPVAHNIWEGRKIIEAANKYKRIIQSGTQFRSDEGVREAFNYIQSGNLGKIQLVRAICYKQRESIGKVNGPQPIPATVDYNLFQGPADMHPLMRKMLHYDWHWFWETGNGEFVDNCVHFMDLCRWVLGNPQQLPKVMSIGGRFGFNDDGQTPNTQLVLLENDNNPNIVFEVRNLPRKKDDTVYDQYCGIRQGVVVQCENGYFAGNGGGGWVYDNNNRKVKQFIGDGGLPGHLSNFIEAVRSRKQKDLKADICCGYNSSLWCLMGIISHRVGQLTPAKQISQILQSNNNAAEAFERLQKHLSANDIDISKASMLLGPSLKMDEKGERFIGDSDSAKWANMFIKRNYREPFVVPDKV